MTPALLAHHPGLALGVRVARQDLAALLSGQPVILVDARLPDAVALHGAGARVCRAFVGPDAVTLRLGPAAAERTVALEHPPAGVLALVSPTPRGFAALQAWWAAKGARVPPLIVAEGGLAALPALLEISLANAAEAARDIAALEAQVVALRQEGEELRSAVAALLGTLGGHAPATLDIRIQTTPDAAAPPLVLEPGAMPLLIEPGLPTTGVSQLSLHLAAPAQAGLVARLIAAETARVMAAWRVPAAALSGGWIHLETPEPLAGRHQTLLVELEAEGDGGEVKLSPAAGAPGEPALMLAVLPPGARLVQPLHMDWSAWQADAPPGVARLAPAAALADAQLEGPGQLDEPAAGWRRATLPQDWETARIALGALPDGIAALRWDIEVEDGVLEARLAVEPDGPATEWRLLAPGEPRPFALPIPPGGTAILSLRGTGPARLMLRQPAVYAAPPVEAPATAAGLRYDTASTTMRMPPLRAIEGSYPRETVVPAEPSAYATGPDGGPGGTDTEREAGYSEVVLDARQRGTGWELLDLRVSGLAFRGERWRELKFKFGIAGGNAILEFRRAPSWPRAFDTWPGTESDAYGDKFVLVAQAEAIAGIDQVALGRDTTLVAAIANAMPRILAEVLADEEAQDCAAAARDFATRLGARGEAEAA